MRSIGLVGVVLFGLVGCNRPGAATSSPNTATPPPSRAVSVTTSVKRNAFTNKDNPTASAGRGEPSLDDPQRPAAWVYIDGQPGRFTERDGHRLIQWTTERPVGSLPTFRVEGFDPLIGDARDFKCILQTLESTDGNEFTYEIAAKPGTFATGQDFSLLNPGDNFEIRNGRTRDVVREIAPLAPGSYAIAAGLQNTKTGKRAAAVTYFTVAEGK